MQFPRLIIIVGLLVRSGALRKLHRLHFAGGPERDTQRRDSAVYAPYSECS